MFRYGSLLSIFTCVAILFVAAGCTNPPTPEPNPTGDIPAQTNDSVSAVPIGGGRGDAIPPIPPVPPIPPMSDERQAEGTRITNVVFSNVMFEFDSFRIASSEIAKIQQVGEFLRKNTTAKLVAEGHCDERGSNEYNMSLGEHRAQAVRASLVSLGIDASRIQTRSFGEEKPADPNHNEQAWRKNRRVEFALFR